jgi:3-deoxy-D-manno-octulosonate 8-phosphate phosphatase (KDO 8-P phosphatase)
MKIQLIVYDFDGVLTDNRVWVDENGKESVVCNRSDGWWMQRMTKMGIQQVILSSETNLVVSARGRKLGIPVHQGHKEKLQVLKTICSELKIELKNVCYVGNEVNDLASMRIVGMSACPEDSHPLVLKEAKQILSVRGGYGVVPALFERLFGFEQLKFED